MGTTDSFSILTFISNYIGISPKTLERIIITVVILLFYFLLRRIIFSLFIGRMEDTQNRYLATKLINYVLSVILLIIIGSLWLKGSGLIAYVGILSAGLAIALQDLIINFAGWLFIIFRRPFTLGNRIEIGNHKGDVIDIRVFMFYLMEVGVWAEGEQTTGRVIHIPNGWIFKQSIANYHEGFKYIFDEIKVTITFESNWEQARDILTYIINEYSDESHPDFARDVRDASREYMLSMRHFKSGVWSQVTDNGVTFHLRYICDPVNRWQSASFIWETILHAFSEHEDIEFAYPTTRYYDSSREGRSSSSDNPSSGRSV